MNMLRHASLRRRLFSSSVATLSTRALSSFSSAPSSSITQPTVVVALSGGVDSSVAAALLKQRYGGASTNGSTTANSDGSTSREGGLPTITAIHMSNWNATQHDDDSLEPCSSERDWKDAVATAEHLQLPVSRVHFEAEYWTMVFEPYLDQLMDSVDSRMGNPDMLCNRFVKFGALRDFCLERYGADTLLATGHYARLWHRDENSAPPPEDVQQALDRDADLADWLEQWGVIDDREVEGVESSNRQRPPILLSAADTTKDQSYFLAACDADSLRNVIFPLGDLYKKQAQDTLHQGEEQPQPQQPTVRQLAADMKLPTASKKESMGICFVGKRPGGFRHFVTDYLPPATNKIEFVDVDTGAVIATSQQPEHVALYTIGQGAKLSGFPIKYFCVDTEPDTNIVKVCAGTHHAALYANSLSVAVNWMAQNQAPRPLMMEKGEMRAQCRIRHLQPLVNCTIVATVAKDNDSSGGTGTPSATATTATTYQVHFDKPVRGITPGQAAVFYVADGLICLGGGPIMERGATYFEQGLALPTNNLHPAGLNDLSVPGTRIRQQQQQ
jgi:tRNA U34 2-thiouridine synthase MnmA/TrmU